MDIKTTIKGLPTSSGVYLYKDAAGAVIYVGKAVNIRKRVESYFRTNTGSLKTDFLVSTYSSKSRPSKQLPRLKLDFGGQPHQAISA